jgi:hypothetical protein
MADVPRKTRTDLEDVTEADLLTAIDEDMAALFDEIEASAFRRKRKPGEFTAAEYAQAKGLGPRQAAEILKHQVGSKLEAEKIVIDGYRVWIYRRIGT